MQLNHRAHLIVQGLIEAASVLRVDPTRIGGATVVDCGVNVAGGLEAGRRMARVALAGLARVQLQHGDPIPGTGLSVCVQTDQPVWACLASQYAGWPIQEDGYFAMASGPMRLLRGREPLLEVFVRRFQESTAVGVLETGALPSAQVVRSIAEACRVQPEQLVLLVAPTRSIAGTLQIVARSVETALHKLHEIVSEEELDLHAVLSASGSAPLPPPAADDLTAIGRTNDAILYGAQVTLWIDADDSTLRCLAPRLPSSSSPDYGKPFRQIFDEAKGDFYSIDPMLFSPACVRLISVRSGSCFRAGEPSPRLLTQSFAAAGS